MVSTRVTTDTTLDSTCFIMNVEDMKNNFLDGHVFHLCGSCAFFLSLGLLFFPPSLMTHIFKHSHLSFPIKTVVLLLFSHQVVFDSLRPHGLQHARLPCPSPSPGVCPSSCSLNQWCYPTISFSDKDRSANKLFNPRFFFCFFFFLAWRVLWHLFKWLWLVLTLQPVCKSHCMTVTEPNNIKPKH